MTSRSRSILAVECLESRLAPAVTIVNATTATFTDVDGDLATIKVSTGTLTAGLFTTGGAALGEQLQTIDFSGGGFDHADLTVSAKRVPTGDGLVNVGYINSTGHDLGKVTVVGDLAQVDAGDSDPLAPAVASLNVRSIGRYGLDTQFAGGSLNSHLYGSLGKLTVRTDVVGVFLNVNDGTHGSIGSVTIGGSLIGGSDINSGRIQSIGDMGLVRIGHDLVGGMGEEAGEIQSSGRIAGVTIGGSLIGGLGRFSAQIHSGTDMGPVKIAHDLFGGLGLLSGAIRSDTTLAGVTIGGSVIGGTGPASGVVLSTGDIGPVRIGHDLVGADIGGADTDHDLSGVVESVFGRIASVSIGGSIIAGTDTSPAGTYFRNATIQAGNDIGSVTVRGSLIGNTNPDGNMPVIISARGREFPVPGSDLAIGKVTIGRRVENARILAGYNPGLTSDPTPVNADAQIGSVTVGGDWVASSIVAGAVAGADNQFGSDDDFRISGPGTTNNPSIDSKIGSITIKGLVIGTPGGGSDHFGFVAQQIGAFKAVGFKTTPTAGMDAPAELSLTTKDVTIREVA